MLALYVSLGMAAILLNIFFVVMVWKKSKVSQVHKHYMSSLAASNLLTCLLFLNWDIRMDKIPMDTSPWVCVVQFYGVQIGIFSTLGTVIVMSVDKCIAIRRASSYKRLCSVRNTRLVLCIIYVTASLLALLPSEDFVTNLSPVCTVIDLYPRRYGILVIASVLLLYQVGQIVTLATLVSSLIKFIHSRNVDSENKETISKAHRANRIILCSSVLYSTTIIPMIGFFYWMGRRDLSIEYIVTHKFSLAVNCIAIIFTYVDPIIYFVCSLNVSCRNKVEPSSPDAS